jgi:hypothetical protein
MNIRNRIYNTNAQPHNETPYPMYSTIEETVEHSQHTISIQKSKNVLINFNKIQK